MHEDRTGQNDGKWWDQPLVQGNIDHLPNDGKDSLGTPRTNLKEQVGIWHL